MISLQIRATIDPTQLSEAQPLGYLQKANGTWSDSSKESLDLFLDAHFPGSQQTGYPPERSVERESN